MLLSFRTQRWVEFQGRLAEALKDRLEEAGGLLILAKARLDQNLSFSLTEVK